MRRECHPGRVSCAGSMLTATHEFRAHGPLIARVKPAQHVDDLKKGCSLIDPEIGTPPHGAELRALFDELLQVRVLPFELQKLPVRVLPRWRRNSESFRCCSGRHGGRRIRRKVEHFRRLHAYINDRAHGARGARHAWAKAQRRARRKARRDQGIRESSHFDRRSGWDPIRSR